MGGWGRRGAAAGALGVFVVALLVLGTALGGPRSQPAAAPDESTAGSAPADALTRSIDVLQRQLSRDPSKDASWSDLGLLYLQQARASADPSWYARAAGSFDRSMALRPHDNDAALTGRARLAAARHDFAGALALARQSLAIHPDSPGATAVEVDALVELGHYDQAQRAVDRLLDLLPGPGAYARASYLLELRGDRPRAVAAMRLAHDTARVPADRAFASYYLGELAWNDGDLGGAFRLYGQALAEDPSSVMALAGRARVEAAQGHAAHAVADYRAAVARQPLPQLLVELGELLEVTGDAVGAREQYDVVRAEQRLYAADGQDVDTELAVFEADHGTPGAAVASAERAYRKRPDAVLTQDAYAWALHAAGRDAQALPVALRAAHLGLALPTLRYHLGVIQAAAGQRSAGEASLASALAMNRRFSPLHAPQAARLLARLRQR